MLPVWMILVFAAPALGIPDAMVLIPSEIMVGVPEKICYLQPKGVGSGSLQVTLQHEPTNTTIVTGTAGLVGFHGCLEFTVPDDEREEYRDGSVATVTVIGSGLVADLNITKKVLLKRVRSLVFVQTDKPVYKPGQAVRFRVVSLTQEFLPVNKQYPLITLRDPQENRIGQWMNVMPKQGIADLAYDLNPEPLMGTYQIEVQTAGGWKELHEFSVEEYVLPKFEVKVQIPNLITVLEKTIKVTVCGRYTYGKPMRGYVNGTVCIKEFYEEIDPNLCHHLEGRTDNAGCFTRDLATARFKLRRNFMRPILAQFTLEEDGTGIVREGSGSCTISAEVTKIEFKGVESYYKNGLPLSGKVVIKLATGEPMPGVKVYLFNTFKPGAQEILVDEQGEGAFSLDTSEWEDERVSLMAIYHLQPESDYHSPRLPSHYRGWHSVKRFYSKSGSFLAIRRPQTELPCASELELPVHYIVKALPRQRPLDLQVFQLVMARGKIVSFEKTWHSIEGTEVGSFQIHQRITPDMSPITRILVFAVLPNGEVIADSGKFKVATCFKNQVQLKFSGQDELPGSGITVDLHAAPGSLCGLRVVDKSVLLLKPEKELTVESIFSLLPMADLHEYNYRVGESYADFCPPELQPSWYYRNELTLVDVHQLLEGMGLKIFTDLDYHAPVECKQHSFGHPVGAVPASGLAFHFSPPIVPWAGGSPPEEKVREYFPETWIWDLVPVSASGQASLDVTVPDTITEWKGGAFCSGDAGFGLSPTVGLTVFKPFFVELALPYSVVRTEGFSLKAKVFNYLADSLMVRITLEEAEGFELPSTGREAELCVLSKDSATVTWELTASGLGKVNITVRAESISSSSLCGNEAVVVPVRGAIDVVRKPLIIEPEGTEVEFTRSSLLCPAGKKIAEQIHLQVPEDVVEGSARAYVAVLGDLMGSAMENLDHLLSLPTGCGEQNMVKFAPNIYVLSYLQQTHQLTAKVKEEALGFLQIGYQRQMNYKHYDGSFSAFGKTDKEGNTWLTAFVLKSFLHAQPYIFIDESVLKKAASFFLKNRLESGCFANVGKLLHSGMKGGVDDTLSLSAYVTTALIELDRLRAIMANEVYEEMESQSEEATPPNIVTKETQQPGFKTTVLEPSLHCLRKQMATVNNTYTLALLAYTFTLAGDDASRDRLLEKLEGLAIKKDGMTHWTREPEDEKTDKEHWYWWRAPSAEVEMTAYVLLALLSRPQVPPADLQRATRIVSWLVRQRNAYGGFASTQDTVVALHALSLYGSLTHVADPQGQVTLTGKNKFHREIRLDATNQLLLQTETLEDVPGDYTAQVSGSSCLMLQTTLRYNIPPKHHDSAFQLSAEMERFPDDPSTGTVNIDVTYVGPRDVSNMVIVDLKLLSGYSAQKPSHPRISRSETEDGHLVMYIPEMEKLSPVRVSVLVHRDFVVENLQDAFVKVYDYYETDESAIAGYHWPAPGNLKRQEEDPSAQG